jgi:hypothetical protein
MATPPVKGAIRPILMGSAPNAALPQQRDKQRDKTTTNDKIFLMTTHSIIKHKFWSFCLHDMLINMTVSQK